MVAISASDFERYDREIQELRGQVKLLEDELGIARRQVEAAPRQIHSLEKRLAEAATELAGTRDTNARLDGLLREAREQLSTLREEVEKLAKPPSSYGIFLHLYDDGTADVFTNGRKMRVNLLPENIELERLERGREVILNDALNIIGVCEFDTQGEVVTLKEVLEGGARALVLGRTDEERAWSSWRNL